MHRERARIYTCGPTVYDYAHIGNFRTSCSAISCSDIFLNSGYRVTQVMKLTDVDDKTIHGARQAIPPSRNTSSFTPRLFSRTCRP